MPEREIKHEQYKGQDIRSHPLEGDTKETWKLRILIAFPVHGTGTMKEFFEEGKPLYSTLTDAHTAGFEFGRLIIDEWLRTGNIPSPDLAKGFQRP